MNVLLPTLGSSGDVNPFVALGVALQARGHRATLITNPIFRAQVEAHGLGFCGVGSVEAAQVVIANPDLWHVRKSFGVVAQILIDSLRDMFLRIEELADAHTVMAFSTLSLGARVAQEKLGLPSASVHLQPGILRSVHEQGMFANLRLSAAHPKWFKGLIFGLADALIMDRHLQRPLNDFRATLGLAPVARVMHRWLHSPDLVIAFFPPWFARVQPDWPRNLHMVGFPLWDSDPSARLQEALEFLDAGSAPLIFTPGSAGSTMHVFFRECVAAAGELGMRAMLVTNFPEQTPARLPAGLKVFGYLPFSQILPRAALLVYHGGIGTLAQAVKAAVPQLVVPHAHDQFDNAWRLRRLGLGSSIPIRSFTARSAAPAIRGLLSGNIATAQHRQDYARRVATADAIGRAVQLLEQMYQRRQGGETAR